MGFLVQTPLAKEPQPRLNISYLPRASPAPAKYLRPTARMVSQDGGAQIVWFWVTRASEAGMVAYP